MSAIDDTTDTHDPRDDPEGFLREQFDGLEHAVEEIANGNFGELSEDADRVLEILGQDEEDDS